eukprot:scaffold28264_cov117-Skeletonema_marinoi.AAC.3
MMSFNNGVVALHISGAASLHWQRVDLLHDQQSTKAHIKVVVLFTYLRAHSSSRPDHDIMYCSMLKYDHGDRPFWAIDLLIVKSEDAVQFRGHARTKRRYHRTARSTA